MCVWEGGRRHCLPACLPAGMSAARRARNACDPRAQGGRQVRCTPLQKFQFRRRLRIFLTDARRMLPLLGRRLHDFSGTPMGAITFFFAFLVSGEGASPGAAAPSASQRTGASFQPGSLQNTPSLPPCLPQCSRARSGSSCACCSASCGSASCSAPCSCEPPGCHRLAPPAGQQPPRPVLLQLGSSPLVCALWAPTLVPHRHQHAHTHNTACPYGAPSRPPAATTSTPG